MQTDLKVRPMRMGESVLILLLVTLLGVACFYGLRLVLERAGWVSTAAYLVSLSVVFVVMLVWSIAVYFAEGQPTTMKAFLRRNRLESLNSRVLLWGIGLGLIMLFLTAAFSPLLSRAVSSGLLPLPGGIPDYLNPVKQLSLPLLRDQFAAQGVLPLIPIVLVLNIAAEELFWRGMVFPRQELQHGKQTYIVHGLIWAFSHAFQYWMLPPILLGSLALAYAVQRTRNTWVGIFAHLLNNALPFLVVLFIAA